jgi:hypothetical protein
MQAAILGLVVETLAGLVVREKIRSGAGRRCAVRVGGVEKDEQVL